MDANISYFDVLFVKCGPIGWVLWGLSIVTLGAIVRTFLTIRRARLVPPILAKEVKMLLAHKQLRRAVAATGGDGSLLGRTLHASLNQAPRGFTAMEKALEETAETEATKLLRRIEWLKVIGNVGPMLGLLGTVWGMIVAFFTIVARGGTPQPADLAGAIGTALVTTLVGLTIAIPSLATYAAMRHRIDVLTSEVLALGQQWLAACRPAERRAVIPLAVKEQQAARA